MRKKTIQAFGLAILLLPLAASASADPIFAVSGFFLAGSPSGALLVDACGNDGATEGVDSNCVSFGSDYSGTPYVIQGTAEAGTPEFRVCFYHDDIFLGCDTGYVPTAANRFSVSSVGGTHVEWTLTLEVSAPS